jgi:hypothetical protein
MKFIEKWISFFRKEDAPHWGSVIEGIKQTQAVNHHSNLCILKKLTDRVDGLSSEYKQLLDLVFKNELKMVDMKNDLQFLKIEVQSMRLKKKKR